ncbi:MAG: hypothetical protein H0T19_07685, partial [Thermoleophilaceae bacterium]|nr:hypothetical protein [Thermoleophilaceae bacterium]
MAAAAKRRLQHQAARVACFELGLPGFGEPSPETLIAARRFLRRVEAEAEAILAPYFEALAQGEGVEQRMRAAERLLDRVFGRPKQSTQPGGRATGRAATYDLSSELDKALE